MSVATALSDLLLFRHPFTKLIDNASIQFEQIICPPDSLSSPSSQFARHLILPLLTGYLSGFSSRFFLPFSASGIPAVLLSSVSAASTEYGLQKKSGNNSIEWGRILSAGLSCFFGTGTFLLFKNKESILLRTSLNLFQSTVLQCSDVAHDLKRQPGKSSLNDFLKEICQSDLLSRVCSSLIQGEAFHRGARLFIRPPSSTRSSETRRKEVKSNTVKTSTTEYGHEEVIVEIPATTRHDSGRHMPPKIPPSEVRAPGTTTVDLRVGRKISPPESLEAALEVAFQRIQRDSKSPVTRVERPKALLSDGVPLPADRQNTEKVSSSSKIYGPDEASDLIRRALHDREDLNALIFNLRTNPDTPFTNDHRTQMTTDLLTGLRLFNPYQFKRLNEALRGTGWGTELLENHRASNERLYRSLHPKFGGINPASRAALQEIYQDPTDAHQIWEVLAIARTMRKNHETNQSRERILAQRAHREAESRPKIPSISPRNPTVPPRDPPPTSSLDESFADLDLAS